MKPTNELRFVKRIVTHTPDGVNPQEREVTILQQWWSESIGPIELKGEWRDVRMEEEQ